MSLGMVDADSLVDSDSFTTLADELNRAMDGNVAAQAAYLATWGVRWEPLPTAGGESYFASTGATRVRTESSDARTVR